MLGVDLLEYWRLTTNMVIMYKIVPKLVGVDQNALITVNSSFAKRNSLKL